MKTAIPAAFAALCLAGCTTIVQKPVQAKAAILGVLPVKTATDYILPAGSDVRATYDALISVYGKSKLANGAPIFVPPLRKDAGITVAADGSVHMTFSAMEDFGVLQGLRRQGWKP